MSTHSQGKDYAKLAACAKKHGVAGASPLDKRADRESKNKRLRRLNMEETIARSNGEVVDCFFR